MSFQKRQRDKESYSLVVLNIFASAVLGISIAAVFQRLNGMFFYNVFIGAIFSGLMSYVSFKVIFRNKPGKSEIRPYVTVISVLVSFSFLSTIPLTVDRSYSVWLLKYAVETQQAGKTIDLYELNVESTNFFSTANGQLDRRIKEQVRIGNFKLVDKNVIEVSRKGLFLAKMNSLIGVLFGLEPKYSRLKMP